MARLSNKVAIITGAGSGIGRAGALLFAREGASVVVLDADPDRVRETTEAVEAAGGQAMGIPVDVRDAAAMVSAADAAMARFGVIDILWNNAGIGGGVGQPIEEISLECWREVMAVNLDGTFHGLRAVLPHMKARRRGAVLMTSSIMALRAYAPGGAPYTASKGAVVAMTRHLALELAAFNVRVNCIAPGPVNTNMAVGVEVPQGDAFDLGWTVQGPAAATDAARQPEPHEIAQTALFLVDDDAGPMTGAVLAHDGGITAF